MYTPKEAIEETVIDILSWDGKVSYESIIQVLSGKISNLKSQIGEEYHKKLIAYGIKDETGMTWDEQDDQSRELINDYTNAITEVKKRNLDLKALEDEMLEWMKTH